MIDNRFTPLAPNLWGLLSLPDEQLESTDLVVLNLTVAKRIPSVRDLDIDHYVRVVDHWTEQFADWLSEAEAVFERSPWKWQDDIHFFRLGMLQGFLANSVGISYVEEQRHLAEVYYTDPGDLFLHGLIDSRRGTCGNMPVLHAAMARRLGWPVSVACVNTHNISRFDNGVVSHNIEATATRAAGFCSNSDEDYVREFGLPTKAITSGSDLRCLTAREMLGLFVALRARHYMDSSCPLDADTSFALSRVLFPCYRAGYIKSLPFMLKRGEDLFEPGELGHPVSVFEELAPVFAPDLYFSCLPLGGMQTDFQYVTGHADVPQTDMLMLAPTMSLQETRCESDLRKPD